MTKRETLYRDPVADTERVLRPTVPGHDRNRKRLEPPLGGLPFRLVRFHHDIHVGAAPDDLGHATFFRYERRSIEQRHARVRGRIQREQRKDDRRRDFHDQQVR